MASRDWGSIPPAPQREKQKIFYTIKQRVTILSSMGIHPTLLDIVCFSEMKGEEKQGDGGAFQGLAQALSGLLLATGFRVRRSKGLTAAMGLESPESGRSGD